VHYRADPRTPALAGWRASAQHEIRSGGRQLQLGTTIDVRSTADSLHVSVRRILGRNGRTIRSRTWTEAYPRTAH
jgi:hypothetical protein